MSAFADLLAELDALCLQRYDRPLPRHFRDNPEAAREMRWRAWLEMPPGATWPPAPVGFGESGEQALRRLVEALRGSP